MQSEVIARLKAAIADAEADMENDYAAAETTGERVDLYDYGVSISLEDAMALEAALSVAEPVGQVDASYGDEGMLVASFRPNTLPVGTKLYAAPPSPSVAVKPVAPVDIYKAVGLFIDNDTFDKDHVSAICRAIASALSAQVQDVAEERTEVCERCQGNGEIVTNWERYRHPYEGDVGDEAVAECPDCDGIGKVSAQDGWKIVPIAPTEEMLCAVDHDDCATPDAAQRAYRAMLAAAPAKQEGGE